LPALTFIYKPYDKTTITWITSAVLGHRNSVLFEGFANKLDTINTLTQTYANRTVDIDEFRSYTSELRFKQLFRIANVSNSLTAGIRAFNNVMWRRQLGRGTTGSDFDLSVEPNSFKRDLKFHSQSIALSVENAIHINSRWSVSPGFRYEVGQTNAYGSINYINADSIPRIIEHQLPAFGLATKYKPKGSNSVITAGISQAHRPVIFKDIIPGSALERAAHDLKNATGYNAELSYNNFMWKDIITPYKSKYFNYTLSLYQTQYNNRMGNWVLFDSLNSNSYIQKTNIGNSRTRGLECLFKYTVIDHKKNRKLDITNATAIQQAKYTKATAVSAGKNVSIAGNSVEGVPTLISRTSIGFQNNMLYLSVLYSYVSAQFSDALNTVNISANGSVGKVPAYGIIDIQGVYKLHSTAKIRFGLNNLLNKSYYTKRPTMYPGPGIWPSDGRGFNLGLEINF
jgi:Fe(3+) dicitrate transport protein